MICDTCESIFRGDRRRKDHPHQSVHHATKDRLLQAVREHCQICIFLWREILANDSVEMTVPQRSPSFRQYKIELYDELGFFLSTEDQVGDESPLRYICGVVLLWVPDPSSSSLYSVPQQRDAAVSDNTASTDCFNQARSWISNCLRHHQCCGRPENGALYNCYPTRLLDLQPQRTDVELCLRLTHQNPPETPYMTLSHCWGTAKFLQLTSTTFEHLKAGFRIRELPKSFRDAIQITRELGVRYLWIDALCILQDSTEDWRHESAMMMKVYQNSHCSIAAADASDSEQGCFSHRDPLLIPPIIIRTQWNDAHNRSRKIYPCYPSSFWKRQVEGCPLNRRAWVIQERLLAPRIIYYGKEQLLWECLELKAYETYPDGIPQSTNIGLKSFDLIGEVSRKLAVKPEQKQSIYKYWHEVVEAYSECKLTRAEDKLVAISGLAKRVQPFLGDEYLAGLWKESLLSELLWRVQREHCNKKIASYRAPTWSWASVEGRIKFNSEISDLTLQVVTVLASGVTVATADVTGQVTDGFIRLSGRLLPALIRPKQSLLPHHYNCIPALLNYQYECLFVPDFHEAVEHQTGILFLPISTAFIDSQALEGLVLELVDAVDNTYKRIGYSRLWIRDWQYDGKDSDWHDLMESFDQQILTLI